jgi:hypothetical protein
VRNAAGRKGITASVPKIMIAWRGRRSIANRNCRAAAAPTGPRRPAGYARTPTSRRRAKAAARSGGPAGEMAIPHAINRAIGHHASNNTAPATASATSPARGAAALRRNHSASCHARGAVCRVIQGHATSATKYAPANTPPSQRSSGHRAVSAVRVIATRIASTQSTASQIAITLGTTGNTPAASSASTAGTSPSGTITAHALTKSSRPWASATRGTGKPRIASKRPCTRSLATVPQAAAIPAIAISAAGSATSRAASPRTHRVARISASRMPPKKSRSGQRRRTSRRKAAPAAERVIAWGGTEHVGDQRSEAAGRACLTQLVATHLTDELSVTDQQRPITQRLDVLQQVRGEEQRTIGHAREALAQHRDEILAHHRVEAVGRFIEHQEGWPVRLRTDESELHERASGERADLRAGIEPESGEERRRIIPAPPRMDVGEEVEPLADSATPGPPAAIRPRIPPSPAMRQERPATPCPRSAPGPRASGAVR